MPEDGYDHWKTCKFFEIDDHVFHYEEKLGKLKTARKALFVEKKSSEDEEDYINANQEVSEKGKMDVSRLPIDIQEVILKLKNRDYTAAEHGTSGKMKGYGSDDHDDDSDLFGDDFDSDGVDF